MKQILQIFTAIVVLTNIIYASSFRDPFEAHKRDAMANCIQDGSSQEETSPVRWKSPKQAVDLESFLSSARSRLHVEPISFNLGDVPTQAAKPKSTQKKIIKTGVGAFVKMHLNVAAKPLTVQSSRNAQNATVTAPATQQNKHNLDQSSMLTFVTNKRMKGDPASDSEGSTDRESLTRSDSLTISLPSTSNSAGSDISSDEDNTL